MSDTPADAEALLRRTYAAFNARDIAAVLATFAPDVDWPASTEGGGRVRGHEAVRAYWLRQWAALDPRVDPVAFATDSDGRVVVTVRQLVRDVVTGAVVFDGEVRHAYTFAGGLVARMDILG